MDRVLEHVPGPAVLDDLAEVHHRHPVSGKSHRGDVVRDEQVGDPPLALELDEAVQDLGLDGHVERAGRFVQHDQAGADGERPREREPLPTASRELVGVLVQAVRRQPDARKERLDPRPGLPSRELELGAQRLPHDLPDPQSGVEGTDRVLEDHLDVAPPQAQLLAAEVGHVLPLEPDLTLRRLVEAGDEPAERGLAGARLADEPQRLPGPDGDRDPVHRVDRASGDPPDHVPEAAREREQLLDADGFEQGGGVVHGSPGTSSGK